MDIGMPREDYDTLIEHAAEWLPAPYHIVTHENNNNYPKYFAKIEDTSTTLVENRFLNYIGGIYIDVFPLDNVLDNKLLRAIHFYKFNLVRRFLYFSYRDPFKYGKGLRSIVPLIVQRMWSRKHLHRIAQGILKEYKGRNDCHYVMTHDDGFRAYNKKLFETHSSVVFEGVSVVAPADTDEFLKVMYGNDYMQPPSLEKRVSHFHDYCDFNMPYKDFDISKLRKL